MERPLLWVTARGEAVVVGDGAWSGRCCECWDCVQSLIWVLSRRTKLEELASIYLVLLLRF